MSSKMSIEQISTNLKAEEKAMRDQVVYLNGQIAYNRKMQEVFSQLLCDLRKAEEVTPSNKSKTSKKSKK